MEDNVVFNPAAPTTPAAPATPQVPVAQPIIPTQPLPTQIPPPQPVVVTQPSGKSKILKIVGGVLGALILIFLLIKLVSALHGKPAKVTLVYWGLWEDSKVMNTVFDEFHQENPDITVEYKKRDISQYKDSLVTQIANGSGPDLFRFHNSWTPTLTKVLLPLSSDVISPADFQKEYYPVVQQDLIRQGAIYGIPLEIDTLALFYNKTIFASAGLTPPKTWNEVASIAANLTVEDGNGDIQTAGISLGTYDNITHAPDVVSLLLLLQGVNPKKLACPPGENVDCPTVDALTYYADFSNGQKYVDRKVWDPTQPLSKSAFAAGTLAMYFGYSWDILDIQAASPDLPYGVVTIPTLFGKKETVASYWVEGVSAQSKHKKEALKLMHFLTEKTTLQKLYAAEKTSGRPFGEPYPRIDMADLLKDDPNVSPFLELAPYAGSSIFAADTYDQNFNGTLNTYLGNTVTSLQPGGNTSPDTAVGTLSDAVAQVLAQYGVQ